MEVLGLIGLFVFLAGLHLTWQARDAILYWVGFGVATWRSAVRSILEGAGTRSAPSHVRPSSKAEQPIPHTLRLVGGIGLIFLGQLLFVLALVS